MIDLDAYQEIEDHLETLQDLVCKYNSRNVFNEIFRLVHCVKGTSQMIEDQTLIFIFHHLEDYLIHLKQSNNDFDAVFLKYFYHLIDLGHKQVEKQKTLEVA